MSHVPDYDEIDVALGSVGQAGTAASAHGALTGMLSAGGVQAGHAWIEELLSGVDVGDATRDVLDVLVHASAVQLLSEDFSFQPLLPDDETDLSQRARALGEWVQGYLYGLGVAGFDDASVSGETKEALEDLEEIGRVEFNLDQADESDEVAYAEVLEFVRTSAMLINDEIGAMRGDGFLH